MSMDYAQKLHKLSYREDVGDLGMSEVFDPPHVLQTKIEQLALMIKKSNNLVAFTGAGISTSCGIPDFRGPKGVWTLQRAGKGIPEASLPFHRAMPSLTHMALVELERAGILKFVISQNIDSLHLRSGIPRGKLAELHGNSFRELCPSCGAEYLRDFEIETIGMKVTSRRCSDVKCGAKLRDTVLDWGDALPEKEMNPAEQHSSLADVVLCLGTSLQITPACDLPLKSLDGGGKFVIVNLQPTPKDKKASLVINGQVDKDWELWDFLALSTAKAAFSMWPLAGTTSECRVIAGVMDFLNLRIPPYIRIDFIQISLRHAPRKKTYVKWVLKVANIHGSRAVLPFVRSVEVSFPQRPDMKTAFLTNQPFVLKRETTRKRPFTMALRLNFTDGCGCSCTTVIWEVDFQVKLNSFIGDKSEILRKLRGDGELKSQCGQQEIIERKVLPRFESTMHAVVTNIVQYNLPDSTKVSNAIYTSDGLMMKRFNEGEHEDEMSSKRARWF